MHLTLQAERGWPWVDPGEPGWVLTGSCSQGRASKALVFLQTVSFSMCWRLRNLTGVGASNEDFTRNPEHGASWRGSAYKARLACSHTRPGSHPGHMLKVRVEPGSILHPQPAQFLERSTSGNEHQKQNVCTRGVGRKRHAWQPVITSLPPTGKWTGKVPEADLQSTCSVVGCKEGEEEKNEHLGILPYF